MTTNRRHPRRRVARGTPHLWTHHIVPGGPSITSTLAGSQLARAAWYDGEAAARRWLAKEAALEGSPWEAYRHLEMALFVQRMADDCRKSSRQSTRCGCGPATFRLEAP